MARPEDETSNALFDTLADWEELLQEVYRDIPEELIAPLDEPPSLE